MDGCKIYKRLRLPVFTGSALEFDDVGLKQMLDQALVGSMITQVGALLALAITNCKCHVACKRDDDNEFCEPSVRCAFMDGTLASLDEKMPPGNKEQ